MAVNVNSTQITNDLATPAVLNNPYLAGGTFREFVDVCAVGSGDGAASTYRFCRIPSNARISDIEVMNDALTTGTSYKCGVLGINGGGVVVASSDQIFMPVGTTMVTARNTWTSLYFPAIGAGAAAVANIPKRIWELLGLTSDPNATYDVVITAVTASTVNGNISIKLAFTS